MADNHTTLGLSGSLTGLQSEPKPGEKFYTVHHRAATYKFYFNANLPIDAFHTQILALLGWTECAPVLTLYAHKGDFDRKKMAFSSSKKLHQKSLSYYTSDTEFWADLS